VVTYRYTEISESACPRFPRYIGPRLDLNWVTDLLYLNAIANRAKIVYKCFVSNQAADEFYYSFLIPILYVC